MRWGGIEVDGYIGGIWFGEGHGGIGVRRRRSKKGSRKFCAITICQKEMKRSSATQKENDRKRQKPLTQSKHPYSVQTTHSTPNTHIQSSSDA